MRPLLDSALTELMPDLDAEKLAILVVCMGRARLPHEPAWDVVETAAVEACNGGLQPRQLAELAWGFGFAGKGSPELFSALRAAMSLRAAEATDQERRVFCWACAKSGEPSIEAFGDAPSGNVDEDISRGVVAALRDLGSKSQFVSYTGRDVEVKSLCADPAPVVAVSDAISEVDCDELVRLADEERLWVPSSELRLRATSGLRTSASATLGLPRHIFNPSVIAIRLWVAGVLGVPEKYIEPLQLVRYSRGQQYTCHVDWSPKGDPGLWIFGQRVATALVYLNTLPEGCGGETAFEQLGLSIAPRTGTAVLWPNVDATGRPDPAVVHEAKPVLCDNETKYAVNVWVRGQLQPDNTWIGWR